MLKVKSGLHCTYESTASERFKVVNAIVANKKGLQNAKFFYLTKIDKGSATCITTVTNEPNRAEISQMPIIGMVALQSLELALLAAMLNVWKFQNNTTTVVCSCTYYKMFPYMTYISIFLCKERKTLHVYCCFGKKFLKGAYFEVSI